MHACYSSMHLGLYSEQIGSQGQALGNFPQALTQSRPDQQLISTVTSTRHNYLDASQRNSQGPDARHNRIE